MDLQYERPELTLSIKEGSSRYPGCIPYNSVYNWAKNHNISDPNTFTSLMLYLEEVRIKTSIPKIESAIRQESKKNDRSNRNRRSGRN